MSKQVGDDLVAAGVRFIALYAGTEFCTPSISWYPDEPTPEDDRTPQEWDWLVFADMYKLRWLPQDPHTYELQVLVSDQPSFIYWSDDQVHVVVL